MDIKDRVKELRKKLNLTLKEFGEKIGVQSSAVSKWESGENNDPDQVIKSICREYDVSDARITTGEGEMLTPVHRRTEIE